VKGNPSGLERVVRVGKDPKRQKNEHGAQWTPQTPAQELLHRFLADAPLRGVDSGVAAENPPVREAYPREWSLLGERILRQWQVEGKARWFHAGCRGTIKVVTGAGKTHFALSVAQDLQRRDQELRLVIVVPTVALLDQWFRTVAEESNLPTRAIGRLGGGHHDDLSNETRVLIAVLATARKSLPEVVERSGHQDHTLIVIDECHRIGAAESARVMETPAKFRLGLSATPERTDANDQGTYDVAYDESRVGKWLGPIVYELNYGEAIGQQILPPFELLHFGLPLNSSERQKYEELTRTIHDNRERLKEAAPFTRSMDGERLVSWCRRAAAQQGDVARLAASFVSSTSHRKRLLYAAESRKTAALSVLKEAFASGQASKAILFHESIAEVESVYEALVGSGIRSVMEHSGLPDSVRSRALASFRSGDAMAIVSARSLIEGFNVPAADLGIIVASSSSPRQRIQSIGRVLRRYEGETDAQKIARVCIFYARDTVDEAIYEKINWTNVVGLERNTYFTWDPPEEPISVAGAPRAHIPRDFEIAEGQLVQGERYPGRYEGVEYSSDTDGNVRDSLGRSAINPQGVPAKVASVKGSAGKFKVTHRKRHILALRRLGEKWETCFVGLLAQEFEFLNSAVNDGIDAETLCPGEIYSGPREPSKRLRFSQKAGGTIVKKVSVGEFFARGVRASELVAILRGLEARFGRISRFEVNSRGHAFWTSGGVTRFIGARAAELEFPTGEVRSDNSFDTK
jgi:superfamily II DNA or RNA helicase